MRGQRPLGKGDQIVTMDGGPAGQACEQAIRGDLVLVTTCRQTQFIRRGLRDAARDRHAARVANIQNGTAVKIARYGKDAHRQKG